MMLLKFLMLILKIMMACFVNYNGSKLSFAKKLQVWCSLRMRLPANIRDYKSLFHTEVLIIPALVNSHSLSLLSSYRPPTYSLDISKPISLLGLHTHPSLCLQPSCLSSLHASSLTFFRSLLKVLASLTPPPQWSPSWALLYPSSQNWSPLAYCSTCYIDILHTCLLSVSTLRDINSIKSRHFCLLLIAMSSVSRTMSAVL